MVPHGYRLSQRYGQLGRDDSPSGGLHSQSYESSGQKQINKRYGTAEATMLRVSRLDDDIETLRESY